MRQRRNKLCREDRNIFIMRIALVVVVTVGLAFICASCYCFGYHRMVTSDEMRQIATESFFDTRTRNGDVIEKSYMPEDGFTFDSDTMMLSEFYKSTDNLDGIFYLCNNDGEFLRQFQKEYPKALYPSNEWTSDDVLEFYRSSLDSWAFYDSVYLDGRGVLHLLHAGLQALFCGRRWSI